MKPCQLGYICELTAKINTNKWGEEICENREACEEWTLSWGLPYTYNAEERKLTVEFTPSRYYWLKVTTHRNEGNVFGAACRIDGMKFGLSMTTREQIRSSNDGVDIEKIIIQALTEEGWGEPVSIGMQPKISRDGITAIIPTLSRMLGRFRKMIIETLNGY